MDSLCRELRERNLFSFDRRPLVPSKYWITFGEDMDIASTRIDPPIHPRDSPGILFRIFPGPIIHPESLEELFQMFDDDLIVLELPPVYIHMW